ncbi:MAG: efflux RND transporter periplasmic adaptor subunit [Polyangia bacterium]
MLILALIAGAVAVPRLLPKKPLKVRVTQASVTLVRDVVSSATAGEVTPELQATVRAEAGGQVVAVRAKKGDRVKKDQILVELDAKDLQARLRQAQASILVVDAQRGQAQARLQTLVQQQQRAALLAEKGAGTQQLLDDAQAAVREAQQALATAQSQRAQALAALQLAKVARSKAELQAPFDGVLVELPLHPGDDLPPGALAFQIIDDSRLHIDATVDEADAAKVKVGQPAELHLDALPDKAIAGKVARVDPAVKKDLKGARTLTVEVEVADVAAARALGLLCGMSANVEIVVAEKASVLSVPSNVIVGRGLNRFVYVVEREGKYQRAHKRTVRIGLTNWERSEILSGLEAGAVVISSLNEKGLEDGALVQPELETPGAPGASGGGAAKGPR